MLERSDGSDDDEEDASNDSDGDVEVIEKPKESAKAELGMFFLLV